MLPIWIVMYSDYVIAVKPTKDQAIEAAMRVCPEPWDAVVIPWMVGSEQGDDDFKKITAAKGRFVCDMPKD